MFFQCSASALTEGMTIIIAEDDDFILDNYKTAKVLILYVTAPCPFFQYGATELNLLMHSFNCFRLL